MKTIPALALGIIMTAMLSCGNDLNDLLDRRASKIHLDSAQYRYLAYLYSPESGSSLNEAAMADFVGDHDADKIQGALDTTLRFPFHLGSALPGIEPPAETGPRSSGWWETVPSDIQDFINRNIGDNSDAGAFALALAKFLDTPDGSARADIYLASVKTRLDSLIAFGSALENNELDTDVTGSLADSAAIFDDTIVKSLAAMSYGMSIIQVVSMIQNQMASRGLSNYLDVLSENLAAISSLRESLASSMDVIENKIEQRDVTGDPMFVQSCGAVQTARTMLTETGRQLSALDGEDRSNYVYHLLISGNLYGATFTAAQQAALECHAAGVFDGVTTDIRIERETDPFHTNPIGCASVCNSCTGGVVLACLACWACDDRTTLDPVRYDMTEPCSFMPMSIRNIALMRRLSLERLALLAYVYNGSGLLSRRAAFAKQDLARLKEIKDRLTQYAGQIDASISLLEFDAAGAPFWRLYDATNIMLADEKMGLIGDQLNSELRNAMARFVSADSYYRDYIVAARALVLNWEIQLRAHVLAGGR